MKDSLVFFRKDPNEENKPLETTITKAWCSDNPDQRNRQAMLIVDGVHGIHERNEAGLFVVNVGFSSADGITMRCAIPEGEEVDAVREKMERFIVEAGKPISGKVEVRFRVKGTGEDSPSFKALEPWQQRVVKEKDELDEKRNRLTTFKEENHRIYSALPAEEKVRLTRQAHLMREYSRVLGERIEAWSGKMGVQHEAGTHPMNPELLSHLLVDAQAGLIPYHRTILALLNGPSIVVGGGGDYFVKIGAGLWRIEPDGKIGADEQSRADFCKALAEQTAQNIRELVAAHSPAVQPNSVSVVDNRGHRWNPDNKRCACGAQEIDVLTGKMDPCPLSNPAQPS